MEVGIFMTKHSFEFKKKIVLEYLNGKGGILYLSKKYGLTSKSQLHKWVKNYKAFGNDGLLRSRENEVYSFEMKLSIVELYLTSEITYQELAIQNGIKNPATIGSWVNRFRIAGPDALKSRRKGRRKAMDKIDRKTQNKLVEEASVNTSVEHIKELEEELLRLRIENAFLKELRRLRLEDEGKMREWHSSSTVSDKSSS